MSHMMPLYVCFLKFLSKLHAYKTLTSTHFGDHYAKYHTDPDWTPTQLNDHVQTQLTNIVAMCAAVYRAMCGDVP